jgi:hypothetical protein
MLTLLQISFSTHLQHCNFNIAMAIFLRYGPQDGNPRLGLFRDRTIYADGPTTGVAGPTANDHLCYSCSCLSLRNLVALKASVGLYLPPVRLPPNLRVAFASASYLAFRPARNLAVATLPYLASILPPYLASSLPPYVPFGHARCAHCVEQPMLETLSQTKKH